LQESALKLYYTATSPYARRCRLAVRAGGLDKRVEEVDVAPLGGADHLLLTMGPGGKVPGLLTDSGIFVCETLLICEILDERSGGKLRPAESVAREHALELEGIASLLMDSLFVRSHEKRRADGERSQALIDKESTRARRCYDALEQRIDGARTEPDLAAIAVACALGYADWRHAEDGWRSGRAKLSDWFDKAARMPGFAESVPAG
jgi:glutathione S-transferase